MKNLTVSKKELDIILTGIHILGKIYCGSPPTKSLDDPAMVSKCDKLYKKLFEIQIRRRYHVL